MFSISFQYLKPFFPFSFPFLFLPRSNSFVGMLFQPESPRFLASRSLGKAEEALKYFRACENVAEEFEGIEDAVEEDSRPSLLDKIREIWQARKAFVIGGGLLFFQQISGQPAVLYFAPTIFTNAGLGAQASKFASVLGKKLFPFPSSFFLFLQKKCCCWR